MSSPTTIARGSPHHPIEASSLSSKNDQVTTPRITFCSSEEEYASLKERIRAKCPTILQGNVMCAVAACGVFPGVDLSMSETATSPRCSPSTVQKSPDFNRVIQELYTNKNKLDLK